jgi:hypothetical protein
MLSVLTPRAGSRYPHKDAVSGIVEAYDMVLARRIVELVLRPTGGYEMMSREYFPEVFAVREWAAGFGGRMLSDIRVFARSAERDAHHSNLYELRVVPEDRHWFDRLRRDVAEALGLPDAESSYPRVDLMLSAREALADDSASLGLLRSRDRDTPLLISVRASSREIGAPVPPLPSYVVPDATEALVRGHEEQRALAAPRACDVDFGDNSDISSSLSGSASSSAAPAAYEHAQVECVACAVRGARLEAEEAVAAQLQPFRARLVEQVCAEVARLPAERLDHAAVSAIAMARLQSPQFYPGAVVAASRTTTAAGAAAASQTGGGYHGFWRQAGVRDVGQEITELASDVAATVCSMAPDGGRLSAAEWRRGLNDDAKMWARVKSRWVSERVSRAVGARRPLPASLSLAHSSIAMSGHREHAWDPHGLALDAPRRDLVSSLLSGPLKRVECCQHSDYHSSCFETARDKQRRRKQAADGGAVSVMAPSSSDDEDDDDRPTRISLQCRKAKAHLASRNRPGSISFVSATPHPEPVAPKVVVSEASVLSSPKAEPALAGALIAEAAAPPAAAAIPTSSEIEARRSRHAAAAAKAVPKSKVAHPGFGGFKGPSAATEMQVKPQHQQQHHGGGHKAAPEMHVKHGGPKAPVALPVSDLVECGACGGKGKKKRHAHDSELIECHACAGKGRCHAKEERAEAESAALEVAASAAPIELPLEVCDDCERKYGSHDVSPIQAQPVSNAIAEKAPEVVKVAEKAPEVAKVAEKAPEVAKVAAVPVVEAKVPEVAKVAEAAVAAIPVVETKAPEVAKVEAKAAPPARVTRVTFVESKPAEIIASPAPAPAAVTLVEAPRAKADQRLVRVFNASPAKNATATLRDGGAFKPATLPPGMSTAYQAVNRGDAVVVAGLSPAPEEFEGADIPARATVYADESEGSVVLPDAADAMPGHKMAAVKLVNMTSADVKAELRRKRNGYSSGSFGAVASGEQSGYVNVGADNYTLVVSDAASGAVLAKEDLALKHRNHFSVVLRRDSKPMATLLYDARHEGLKGKLASLFHRMRGVNELLSDGKRSGILFAPADGTEGLQEHLARIEASPELLEKEHFAPGDLGKLLTQRNYAQNVFVNTAAGRQLVFTDHLTEVFDAANQMRVCHGIYPHPENRNVMVAVVEGLPTEFPEADGV